MDTSTPTYADAVRLLNSTQSGYKVLEDRRRAGITLAQSDPIEEMHTWLRCLGYEPSDLNRLNAVHVAGTKGKGTTCAFTNSILERYRIGGSSSHSRQRTGPHKIGLYTSPHLVAVRERIRINSEPISEEAFARYFFEVWNALEKAKEAAVAATKPSYFRFVTLMSFHVFMREGVDVAVYEVGVGGELDATNVFVAPAATAVTTLGIDHVETLGATIDKIAWHKAGIFKPGCPALTVPQDDQPEAMAVLEMRARERHTELTVAATEDYATALRDVRITPNEPFQRKNAALAIQLAATVLRRFGVDVDVAGVIDGTRSLPREFVDGLENIVWRGRCESKVTGRQHWYLDGAHNQQSLQVACGWFARTVAEENKKARANPPNVLIFNQQSTRDAVELLRVVHSTMYSGGSAQNRFQYALFCTNVTYKNHSWKVDFVNNNVDPVELKALTLQQQLADIWKQLDPETKVAVMPTVQDAVDFARGIDGGQADVRVLITGSFHLVGGALVNIEGGEDFAMANTSSS